MRWISRTVVLTVAGLQLGCESTPQARYERFELERVDSVELSPFYEVCVEILNERPASTLKEAIAPERLGDISALLSIASRTQIVWGRCENREDMGPFYVAVIEVAKNDSISTAELLADLAADDARTRGAAYLALLARYRVPFEFNYEESPHWPLIAEQRLFIEDIVRRIAPADDKSPRHDPWWLTGPPLKDES